MAPVQADGSFTVTGLALPTVAQGTWNVWAYDIAAVYTATAAYKIAYAPRIDLRSSVGAYGQPLTMTIPSGGGFAPSEPVAISFTLASGAVLAEGVAPASVSGDIGQDNFTFPLPGGLVTGTYVVTARGQLSGATATASYHVQAFGLTITPNPRLGPAGARVTLTGSGFAPDEFVIVMLNEGLPGTPRWETATQTVARQASKTAPATFSTLFSLPADLSPDAGNVLAIGGSSNAVATTTISASAMPVDVVPDMGNPGTTFVVTGTGFAAGEQATLAWMNATSLVPLAGGQADSFGVVAGVQAMVPLTATPAGGPDVTYLVQLTGQTSGWQLLAGFYVPPPTAAISPTQPVAAQVVTVSGDEFGDLEPVTVTLQNAAGATLKTYPSTPADGVSGAVTDTLTLPGLTPATYTATLTGGITGLQAQVSFTVVTPTLTLVPASGPVRSVAAGVGGLWGALEPVSLYWNGLGVALATGRAVR